jgi:hypothetical protein
MVAAAPGSLFRRGRDDLHGRLISGTGFSAFVAIGPVDVAVIAGKFRGLT